MDNGEGRPLDELETGQQDPQDWYFDLPSDAWKRQEEKNRLLRERLRSREQEPADRTGRDPWVLNRPAPDVPKKRGLFGLGRKRREGEEERRHSSPQQRAFRGWPGELADSDDEGDWSTERLDPGFVSEPLRLKPRGASTPGEPTGTSPGPAGMIEPPPLRLRPRREAVEGSRLNWDFGPGAWPGPDDGQEAGEDPGEDGSIVSQMRAWAERGHGAGRQRLGGGSEEGREDEQPEGHGSSGAGGFEAEAGGPGVASEPGADGAAATPGGEDERGATVEEGLAAMEERPAAGLPLLRRRPEDDRAADRGPGKSSRWDAFFGLDRGEEGDEGAGVSEGLAAMREWAKKKPLGEDVRDLSQVPEEFLKPFDWELEPQTEEQEPAGGSAAGWEADAAARPGAGAEAGDRSEAAEDPWRDADAPGSAGAGPLEPPGTGEEFRAGAGLHRAGDGEAAREPSVSEAGEAAVFAARWRDDGGASRFAMLDRPGPGEREGVHDDERSGGVEGAGLAAFAGPGQDGPAGHSAEYDDPLAGLFPVREVPGRAEPGDEKRGLFGRLFGRKRREEPAERRESGTPWLAGWQVGPEEQEATGGFEPERGPSVFEGGRLVADEPPGSTPEGWGSSMGESLASDLEAVSDFAAQVQSLAWQMEQRSGSEPAAGTTGWWGISREGPAAEAADGEDGWAPEVVAAVHGPFAEGDGVPVGDEVLAEEWDPEPVSVEAGSWLAESGGIGRTDPGEPPRPGATVEAGEAWAPEPVPLSQAEFGAAVQAALWGDHDSGSVGPGSLGAEPESDAPRPRWEAEDEEDPAGEAVMSADVAPAGEQAAAREPRPWWEAEDEEDPAGEAVASADVAPATEQAAAREPRPWWEAEDEEDPAGATFARGTGGTEAAAPDGFEVLDAADDDDMWGDIAETAELGVSVMGEDELDLAASLEAQMGAAGDEPAWARPSPVTDGDEPEFVSTEDEGDVILRAFEAHASMPEPETASAEADAETAAALEMLFGAQGTQIVEETGTEPEERPFIRMAAWAPQRGRPADDGWAPAEEVSAEFEQRNAPIGFEFDSLAAAPPWATGREEAAEPAAARSRDDGRLKAWVREVVETVMLAALVFLSVRASFGNFKVDGNSMYPTLENGQFLIVNKLVYSEVDLQKLSTFLPFIDPGDDPTRYVFHGPERGDIVVLRDPRDPSTDLIKRVIGLPGETIEIVNGKVYINDRLLEEPYIRTPWNDTLPKVVIPPDEYFVMGDNRNNSLDSRSAQVGLVSKDLIIGKATLSYLPLSRFGLAPNEKGVLTEQKPVLTAKRLGEE